jgi:hypothetical protein
VRPARVQGHGRERFLHWTKARGFMKEHQTLLDAFADTRRTWDELVSLQPDVIVGSGHLSDADIVELERRVEAHRASIDMLADALDTEPQ